MAFKISDYYNQYKDYYGDASLEDVAKDIYDRGGHANQYTDFETFKKTTGMDAEIQADNEKRRPKSFMDKLSEGVASVAPGLEEIPKGLSAGVQQVRGMGYGLGALAGEVTGTEGLKKWGAEGLKDVEAKTPKAAVGSFSEIENVSDLGKYLAYGVSSNLPNMAISLATGGVGGLAGKTLAKGAIEKATAGIVEKEVAKKVAQDIAKKYLTRGAVAGAATSSIGMEAGSIAGDQLNETGKIDPLRAMAGAIPAGLLDVVPEWYLAKKLGWVGKGATEFKGNLPTRIAKVAGAQFAMEAPMEAVQSAIERASVPGKSLTNAEAWDEYINSFILGGMTGAVVGGAGGVFAKGEQQKETREAKKTALSNTIDEGLKNGKLGEEEFTPGKALGIIKAGLDEGIFSADDISEFRKYEKDHPEFKTGLDTISNHAAKNELNAAVDAGIKNGNIEGVDVAPDDVLKIIAEYHGKGLYTDDDLNNFKEQYPILQTGLNDVLVESAKKKVNDDVPLYLGPEDAAEWSARAREAFTNAAGQRLLPPGQGFTFKDVDYGIPVGEPYGEADVIDVPSVSREIRGLPHAEPVKQLPPGQGFELGGASDIAYPDEFTRKLAEAPEIKAVAPMASIGQESEGSAGASGIEPGGNLEKAPHSLTYTAVKGNSVFDNVQPGNVEQLRSMGYEITENKPAKADVPGAQTVTPSPVKAGAAENLQNKVERRGQAEKAAFIRNEVEINSVKARMAGGKPDTAQLVKDAEKRWGQNQSSEAAKQAKIPADQPTAEKTEVNSGNLPGQKEIAQPGASSQAAPETPANQGIAEGRLLEGAKNKEPAAYINEAEHYDWMLDKPIRTNPHQGLSLDHQRAIEASGETNVYVVKAKEGLAVKKKFGKEFSEEDKKYLNKVVNYHLKEQLRWVGNTGYFEDMPTQAENPSVEPIGTTSPATKQKDKRQTAINKYIEHAKKHMSEDMAKAQAEKWTKAIDDKDYKALRNIMNGINPQVNRLFTALTGLPAKTQKEADASLRSFDPAGWDKWQEEKTETREKEAAERNIRYKQQEIDNLLDKQVRVEGGEVMTYRERYRRLIDEEGFNEIREEKRGVATIYELVNDEGVFVKLPKKVLVPYVQDLIDKKKTAAKQESKAEAEEPSKAANSLTPAEYKNKIIELTLKNAAPYMGNLDNSEGGILAMLKGEVDNATGKILNDYVLEEKGDISEELADYINSIDKETLAAEVLEQAKKTGIRPLPASDLSQKSTGELVSDIFAIINNHVGSRGSISNRKIEVEESLYQKLKPYLKEIVSRAKAKALDVKAYLFGAVDSMPNTTAKAVYEAAAERYIKEDKALPQNDDDNIIKEPKKEVEENAAPIDDGKQEAGTPEDDRGSLAGESTESVSGIEEGKETSSIPEGEGSSDDGELRGSQSGRKKSTGRKGTNEKDSATERNRPEGVGGNNGDISGLQRFRNHRIEPGSIKREGGWKATAKTNLDIIELVKKLEAEGRQATPEEQNLLAKYTGWGASEIANNLFPGYAQYGEIRPDWAKPEWKPLAERLVNLLTPEEIKTAAKSTQYAHYTSEAIIRSIYKALDRFGFNGGKILEPGMGVGSFAGLIPENIVKGSSYTGIEMDGITAKIAKYLYPGHNVLHGDYTAQAFPNNFFDLGVGNPPFSQTVILSDPAYKKNRFKLHDYFFAKTIDKVRPGGLLVFITSRYTMDKQDNRARRYLAERADLLGAIRLPQTAFQQNAGTEVVTDVLFLRKKTDGEETTGQAWDKLAEVTTPEGPAMINEYFAEHPEMVLGKNSLQGSMYGANQYTVIPEKGTDIEEQFAAATENLPQNVYSIVKKSPKEQEKAVVERDFNPKNKKEGGLYISDDGTIMENTYGSGVPLSSTRKVSDNDQKWLKDYIALRDAVKQCQYDQLTDGAWENSLKALQKEYASFIKKNGRIRQFTITERTSVDEDGNEQVYETRRFKNNRLLSMDVEGQLVEMLEGINENGEIIESPFLSGRTIGKPVTAEIKTTADALAVTLDEMGKLDVEAIAQRMGRSVNEVVEELGDLIYEEPGRDGYVLADEYLSGEVVKKLEEAMSASRLDSKYKRNVEALKAVQPEPLKPADITVVLGANWVPQEVYNDFAAEVLGLKDTSVNYDARNNSWSLGAAADNAPSWGRRKKKNVYHQQSMRGATNDWGTNDRGPNEILESILNNSTIKITRTEKVGDTTRTYTDMEATTAANEIAKRMRQRFNSWIWEDAERAGEMLDLYNRRYNTIAGRKFDGSHLTLPGVSLLRKLYDHQKRAIWRIIQSGNTYLNHAVGAGKTYTMIAAGMEMRRLGLVKKPLYVVPKHMLQQFANEFMELYPMANIMVADEENFHTTNRRRFIAQASLNNPDAIIITHPSFGKLKMKEESIAPVRDAFLQELRDSLQDMEDDDAPRHKIKQMEKRIEQAEQRFANMVGGAGKDNVVTFEEMGVDFLFVDEAHQFRKLDFTTNRQAKGIDPNGSIMAMDLYIKSLWLESQNKGRSHCFASGTPIVNTMGELYTIMRFFNEKQMEEDGIRYFDSWANMFGQMAQGMEMNAAGRYELVERFAEFVNIPELMSRVRMFMDILTSSQLGGFVKRPEIKGGKAEIVVAPPSEGLKAYQKDVLQPRIEQSKLFKPSPEQPGNPDPLINIITDGRLASIDLRYVVRGAVNDPTSKLNRYIDGIIQSYKETKDKKYLDLETGKASPIKGGAIICFYNHGFGKSVAQRRGFDARKWLMHRLKEAKIPASEVAWIDDYDTAVKKEAMFKEVRQGTKRILIGSAKKMGTGMNVQRRLAALHYLDPPWYPADVEQPDGRIIRQGNQNEVVDLKRYATKGSYDSSMWQMVARKSKLMEQAYIGDASVRKIQDLSESSQYEMAAALSSGDERVIRLVGLKAEAETLHRLRGAHQQAQRQLYYDRQNRQYDIESTEKQIKKLKEAEAKVPDHVISISGKIGKKEYDKREDFGAEVLKAYNEALNNKNNSPGVSRKIAVLNDIPLTLRCVKQSYAQKDDNLSYTALLTLDVTEDVRFSVAEGGPFVIEDGDGKALITKAVNALNRISTLRAKQESNLREHNDEMKKIKARLGAPFESEQELNEKIAEIAQLEKELLEEGEEVNTGKDEVFDGTPEEWQKAASRDLEDIDPEDEEYSIALAQSARAQALLSQYGKGDIEAALRTLKLAKDNWLEFHEGEPEPKDFDLAQTVIRSIDSGQGRLFKGAQYSRRASGVRGISTARIQSIVDKVTSTLSINPKINVVQHVSECPAAVLKDMERNGILDENGDADVQGFAWRGETWLVGDNLDSDVEAFKVLMHELTHNGLGALLNDNSNLKSVQWQYNNLMDKIISAHRRDIMTIARTTHTHLNLNTIEGRRQAAEEWLCNQSYEAQHKWYDKLITIFNNLVRAMGLDIKLSDSEVRIILREAFQTFEGRNDDVRYMVAAWHGSRGLFNQFSSQKVKTGSFGHGLYFSSMREIAEQYKEGGHLYKVTLAPDESDFLDWDAPINKQSKYVQDVLNNSAIREALDSYEDEGGYVDTGKDVYFALMKEQGSAKAASQLLSDYGIAGNKYLDPSQGESSQNYVLFDDQNVNIEARYARKGEIEKESGVFAKQLDDYLRGTFKKGELLNVTTTPRILAALGEKQLPIVIYQQTIKKVLGEKHKTIPIETLKALPEQLHDPIMVFDSSTQPGSYVFMTSLTDTEGKTIIAAIHIEKRVGRYIVHDVASYYGKDSDRWFVGQIEQGNLKYADKERSRKWLMTRGLYLPKVRGAIYGSGNKLLSKDDLVKKNPPDHSEGGVQYARTGKDPIIKQREIGKGEEKRTAPAVHQSDFETLQAMPELRVKPLGGWLENPIRTFEELGKDVKELFYRPVKEAEHKAKIEFKAIHEQVEKLRKSLPGKSSERIGIYALAQQKDGQEILKSMKITEVPKLDAKEMEAYEWMRENLEEFYEKLQTAREAAGKEGFGKVENYFTFARQFSLAEKLGFSPIFTRSELLNTVMHRKTTSFKYEKHRTGGMSRADLDAFGVFNRYMESATRHVALSPAIAKGREMLLTFKAPGPDGEDTNWLLRDEKPAAAKFLTEWLDFQAGQRKPQFPNLIEKGLGIINKNLAFAILSANIRSALIQPSAIVNTFAEIGPKWTFEGIKGMMDDSIIKKSNVLLSRQFDVNISESLAGMPGKFEAARQAIGNIGMKPLQFLDMITARATWQGAYKKALSEGMGEKAAINYADDVVTKTQGSAMPSDMAPVQRTAIGKSVTMFQTFVINQWGFLTKDVLGINNSQVSKKEAAKKIITFVAMAILFNMFYEDLLEVPAPLPSPVSAFVKSLDKGESMPSASADAAREIASIVPIIGGGLRYGSSPFGAPVEYVTDIFKKMLPNYSGPTRSAPELIGKGLGIPGTTQATKIARVEKKGGSLLDMALGRYDTDNDPRQIKKNMVRKLRNKDASAFADMRKYYQEGKLTKREIKAIRDEASVPEIVWKFKRLPLDEAIEEYKSASAEEKKLLRPVLKSKMHLLSELAPEPRKKKVMELKEALVS